MVILRTYRKYFLIVLCLSFFYLFIQLLYIRHNGIAFVGLNNLRAYGLGRPDSIFYHPNFQKMSLNIKKSYFIQEFYISLYIQHIFLSIKIFCLKTRISKEFVHINHYFSFKIFFLKKSQKIKNTQKIYNNQCALVFNFFALRFLPLLFLLLDIDCSVDLISLPIPPPSVLILLIVLFIFIFMCICTGCC